AKALALEKQGTVEASILEKKAIAEAKSIEAKALAEAKGIEAMALSEEKKGLVEATVLNKKMLAEAQGIEEKANAMKKLDGVGKEHEEFKLKLDKEKTIELAHINIQKDIVESQAKVIAEALKASKIDIVGGETMFFDKIIGSITRGKAFDRMVNNSEVFTEIKDSFLGDGSENIIERIQNILSAHGVTSNDIKNLTLSALLLKLISQTVDGAFKKTLEGLLSDAKKFGIADRTLSSLGVKLKPQE
ncbi:MAG TPA: flotillin family protein, partial [Cytophagaceae bacterium]